MHEIVDGLKNLREGRDTRGNKSALENFQNSDWPWVLHRWSWLWTAFASTRTGFGKHKDWAWSVIREKGINRGLTGPFLLYYYWPGSIFELNESSSSKWFLSAFLLFWLVKKEHTYYGRVTCLWFFKLTMRVSLPFYLPQQSSDLLVVVVQNQ